MEFSFRIAPLGFEGPCVQRPNATTLQATAAAPFSGPFGPSFCAPELLNSGQTSPRSAALASRRSGQFRSPFGSDRRDPNSLAPNRPKARTTRYARQGLVRVPESNTKYGGQGGKTGGGAAPVIEPSISESSGIPKRKNCSSGWGIPAAPAVHRATISWRPGVALGRLR